MISVYTVNDIDYERNGAAVLKPLSCHIKEQAGGSYELSLEHPLDERGTWRLLLVGNIIKAPCPVAPIESAVVGENVDIYLVTSDARIYAKPSAPSRITYGAWVPVGGWEPGDKVTYNDQNYQCQLYQDEESGRVPPPQNPAGWQEISNYTSGAAVLTSAAKGEELYLISAYSQYWLYVQTKSGVVGYIQTSYCTFERTETVTEEPARSVSEQLFRIYNVTVDSSKHTVSVSARHVSYDLAGNLVGACAVTNASAAVALARMRDALLYPTTGIIATNILGETDLFTGDFSWKNPVNALLDPDGGLVSYFKAKLIRDNWDIFLQVNNAPDRGVRLTRGRNLRGVSWKRSADNLITRVVPVAQASDGSELMLPEIWVDSPVQDSYPVIYTEYLKVDGKVGGDDGDGGTYTEDTLRAYMREQAGRRFSVDNADKVSVEIGVEFTLLGDTIEYSRYKALQQLYLYDTVAIRDESIDLDTTLQVSGYDWDAVNQRYDSITLGSVFDYGGRDVTGYNLVNGCIRYNKLSSDTITKLKEAIG